MNSKYDFNKKTLNDFADNQTIIMFEKLGAVSVADAKNNALFKTGRMRNSIRYIASKTKLRVEAQTNYAVHVEYLYKPFLRPLISKFSGWLKQI